MKRVNLLVADDPESRRVVRDERRMGVAPIRLEVLAGEMSEPPQRKDDPFSHDPVLVGVWKHVACPSIAR